MKQRNVYKLNPAYIIKKVINIKLFLSFKAVKVRQRNVYKLNHIYH